MSLTIPVILGTARENRVSEKIAQFVFAEAQKFGQGTGWNTEFVDIRDYPATKTDKEHKNAGWEKIVEGADAFIIVSPEYNHGYPGELKMFLDNLYGEYSRKAFAVCGVSDGGMGGVRMVEQLRLVLLDFHAVPIANAVYFSKAPELFDESGTMKDPSYADRLKKLFEELDWFARALNAAREKPTS